MRIGLVCEGSYPYISGGVSSWAQSLIAGMPEHEFTVLSIMPAGDPLALQYRLPHNVTAVIDISVQFERDSTVRKPEIELTEEESEQLAAFFERTDPSADTLGLLHRLLKDVSPSEFFQSDVFFEIAKRCSRHEKSANFIEYYYMLQGMYLPVLAILQRDIPQLDAVHSVSTGYAGLLAAKVSSEQGIPFLLTEHGIYTREREEEILLSEWIPEPFKLSWIHFFQHLGTYAYRQAHAITTLFDYNSKLQLAHGAAEEKVSIIPNGVRLPARMPADRKANGIFHIGSVLRVVPIKDIKTMLYAARELKDRGRVFRWSILGPMSEDPGYAAECLELQDQLQLTAEVEFTGKADVAQYFPLFDVMVLSSLSEGQPLSILEAFSYEVPCVATNVGSCSELIEGTADDKTGPAGYIVDPLDSSAMADALIRLMDSPGELAAMGAAARKRVESRYLHEQMIASYSRLYSKGGGS